MKISFFLASLVTATSSHSIAAISPETCENLLNVTYPDLRIISSEYLTDKDATINGNVYPDHCLLKGALEERLGADGKHYATGFELRMPSTWNNRFFFQGGGGLDGSVRDALGKNTNGNPDALTLGYAVASTDGGHNLGKRSDATFGAERKALIDYGYNSVELVGLASKALIREAYGQYPSYSYFVGSSNGGRQGLQAAMRHPNLFDGIIAGAPIKEQTKGHVATAWSVQLMSKIAPKDDQGRPIFSGAFSESDLKLINDNIIAQCDTLDGLQDGVVDSAKPCDFDISTLICQDGKGTQCLSPQQASVYTAIYQGPKNSNGEELYVPYLYDAGADFRRWHLGTNTEWPNDGRKSVNKSFKYVFRQPPNPEMSLYDFDFDTDPKAMANASQFVDAKQSDLDAFMLAGGKLIVYHGTGDSGPSAVDTTRWYETLRDRYGSNATAEFAKLYLLTGLGHSNTGIGPSVFPALDTIVAWAENNEEPNMQIHGGQPERTRPMCEYPTYVIWNQDEQSWGCKS